MSLDVHLAPAVTAAQGMGGRSPSSSVKTAAVVPEQRATAGPPVPNGKGSGGGAPSQDQLAATVSKLNQQTQKVQRDLQFVVDRQSGDVVVQVIDTKTKHVIQQIPSKDIMALRHHLEKLSSVLFHGQA